MNLDTLPGTMGILANRLGLRLCQASLGSNPPSISGIQVKNRGIKLDDIIMDAEISLNSDLRFEIVGRHYLFAGIDYLKLKLRFRALFSPLFNESPSIGGIYISLLAVPQIDWRFMGLLRVLNIGLLKMSIAYLFFIWFGIPSRLTVNLPCRPNWYHQRRSNYVNPSVYCA